MTNPLLKDWFGSHFSELHPMLQQLHQHGGKLEGSVNVEYGKGLARIIGKRLGRKMNLPEQGTHWLSVDISHSEDSMTWTRTFNHDQTIQSTFIPLGSFDKGYFLETTKSSSLKLEVDIIHGGWHWRCVNIQFSFLPIPLWLAPRLTAYKLAEQDKYRFHVDFSYPVLGTLVSYNGLLELTSHL